MVFLLLDIKRKINQEALVTSSCSLHDKNTRYVSGVTCKTIARFRRDLIATNPSKTILNRHNNNLFYLLRDRGKGETISSVYRQITSSIRDIELYYDPNRLPKSLFDKLMADPYINAAAILSTRYR